MKMGRKDIKEEKVHTCDIAVTGAGPAGLMAAIMAAREGAHVIVLERNDRPLKKLYATGNGRCNFSNLNMERGVYRGSDPEYAMTIVDYYDRNDLLSIHSDGRGMGTEITILLPEQGQEEKRVPDTDRG